MALTTENKQVKKEEEVKKEINQPKEEPVIKKKEEKVELKVETNKLQKQAYRSKYKDPKTGFYTWTYR